MGGIADVNVRGSGSERSRKSDLPAEAAELKVVRVDAWGGRVWLLG